MKKPKAVYKKDETHRDGTNLGEGKGRSIGKSGKAVKGVRKTAARPGRLKKP
jgi:hypothetical protein